MQRKRVVAVVGAVGRVDNLAELSRLSPDWVLVSIQRDGRVIIPHGDTVFQAGDQVTAFTHIQDAKKLFHCLHGPEKSYPFGET